MTRQAEGAVFVVTKVLAEPNNPAHIETWTSPTIVIIRGPVVTP